MNKTIFVNIEIKQIGKIWYLTLCLVPWSCILLFWSQKLSTLTFYCWMFLLLLNIHGTSCTYQSENLRFCKCFRVNFSVKKKTAQFFSSNFFSNKKEKKINLKVINVSHFDEELSLNLRCHKHRGVQNNTFFASNYVFFGNFSIIHIWNFWCIIFNENLQSVISRHIQDCYCYNYDMKIWWE